MRQYLIALFLLVAGCQNEKPVEIAYHCPVLSLPKMPKKATTQLTKASKPNETAIAYSHDLQACYGWAHIVKTEFKTP